MGVRLVYRGGVCYVYVQYEGDSLHEHHHLQVCCLFYVRVQTFCMVTLCWNHMVRQMYYGAYEEFCGWLCHVNEHWVWFIYKVYAIEVVNKYVYIVWVFQVLVATSHMAYSIARSMFGSWESFASCMFFIKLHTTYPTMFPLPFLYGNMKDHSMYMFCRKFYLKGGCV